MKKFEIKGIIAAADVFSKKEGATTALAITLRDLQSRKENLMPEEIQWVDETTIYEGFESFVMPHCAAKVANDVISKYYELGYEFV
ncbi:MAG: hypothetical protein WCJ45_09240 [bacterium]